MLLTKSQKWFAVEHSATEDYMAIALEHLETGITHPLIQILFAMTAKTLSHYLKIYLII